MALIILNPGETAGTFGQPGSASVIGTNSAETVYIAGNGVVDLDPSFSGSGDTIVINGNAGNYTAQVVGSNLRLTSAGGANILIPFGVDGVSIDFADAAPRELAIVGGNLVFGGQTIPATGSVAVTPGSGGGGGEPGNELFLTAQQDIVSGTGNADTIYADVVQVDGLQVNSLGTGDRVDGNGGRDLLEAQAVRAPVPFNDGENTPIQPKVNDVEVIRVEALQSDLPDDNDNENDDNSLVYFNAKDVRGHEEIWSWRSEGDLIVTNLTTIVTDGGHDDARDTGDITIGMGYTGSDDHQWDASDLTVYFDPDFLLSGQASESVIYYWLLDEAAEQVGGPRLDNINVDGIRFQVDGGPIITLRDPDAQFADTHAGFIAELQDELQDLIDAGIVPADTTLTLDPTVTDTTFLDNGTESGPIPAMVLQTNTSAVLTPVGFSQVEDAIGEYDVYGAFDTQAEVVDLPISVQIALEKAGNGVLDVCDAGDLIVGSMDKDNQGIEVFNVTVYGDASRPSKLEYLGSTGYALREIYIDSDNAGFPDETTYASLAIAETDWFLSLIDASQFLGDLQLGSCCCYDYSGNEVGSGQAVMIGAGGGIQNLASLIATGGGEVEFTGSVWAPGVYSYVTGDANDVVELAIGGDALDFDFADSQIYISTGDGDDVVRTITDMEWDEQPNQTILSNVEIQTGDGNDFVQTSGEGNFRISTGTGDDIIFSDNSGLEDVIACDEFGHCEGAAWVFNVDMGEYYSGGESEGDLPGVPLLYSLIGGGKLTVTFSGAGNFTPSSSAPTDEFDGTTNGDGGAVMQFFGQAGNEGDAKAGYNGYESTVTIDVAGPLSFYGTQKDINDAIIRAIEEDDVLNALLEVHVDTNNTLVVRSKISGVFVTEDLDISITAPTFAGDGDATFESTDLPAALLAEMRQFGLIDSDNNIGGDPGQPLSGLTDGALAAFIQLTDLDNTFYSGVHNDYIDGDTDFDEFDNLHEDGCTDWTETDNVINPGADNDIVVLSTENDDDLSNGYWTLDGHLYDEASNERIVLQGLFGNDTIVNFQTAGFDDFVPQPGVSGPVPQAGFDMLDYSAYLNSQYSTSGSATSAKRYSVTLQDESDGDDADGTSTNEATTSDTIDSLDANEVAVIDFNNVDTTTGADSWAGLTAAHIETMINGDADGNNGEDVWGTLLEGDVTLNTGYSDPPGPAGTSLTNNHAVAILMVQNSDNLGEYKVFQVEWDGTNPDATADVTALGSLDFGTSLVGLDEINLAGSTESFLYNGLGLNQYGSDFAMP